MPPQNPGHPVDEWIIYVRISDDREGRGLGVERQEQLARSLHRTARLGGRILTVCCDNDLTANDKSSRYKQRPNYNRMVALLRGRPGRRGVITYHTDRLHRSPRELEDFIDVAEKYSVPVRTVRSGPIDLSTASGRLNARIACAVAKHESDQKSERVRDKAAQLAASGAIGNGGPRPFGYTRIYQGEGERRKILRDDINPEEADIIRQCARRALDGDTMRTIVRWLNTEGIPTSTGGQWTQRALTFVLRSGRIAGLREHRRQIIGKAVWPAIISEETHQQLRALLDSNQRSPGSRVRIHWLSGYVFCSRCADRNDGRGVKMRVGKHAGKLKYICPSDEGCNGRVIGMADLEDLIGGFVVGWLTDPKILRQIAARQADTGNATKALLDRIDADERRLVVLQGELDDGDDDDLPEVVASIRRLRGRVREARAELAGLSAAPGLRLAGEDLAERWDVLDLDQKQSLLALVVKRILIGPAVRGRAWFDPDRVDIERAYEMSHP